MTTLSRRQFLTSTAATAALGTFAAPLAANRQAFAGEHVPTLIRAGSRVLDVNGKAAKVFGLLQPNGNHGLQTEVGRRFLVRLENRIDDQTLIHWHGLTPPYQQDGVPGISQPALRPGQSYDYGFPLQKAGTNWMHSHHGLQEQRLMAAPLIVRDRNEVSEDIQEVVVMLHDFTFRDPAEILAELAGAGQSSGAPHGMTSGASQPMSSMAHGASQPMPPMVHGAPATQDRSMTPAVHLNDVQYDAFLANDRTLADPEVVRVERSGRVRLRIINAATTTNFHIDLNGLSGTLIAVDGMQIQPIVDRRFELAVAQRLDIILSLPPSGAAFPIFAVREDDTARTGVLLAGPGARVIKVAAQAEAKAPPVGLSLERRLRAKTPLPPRQADRRHTLALTERPGYVWEINGAVFGEHKPLALRKGERVEIAIEDRTTMAHPMHLHGHHFQVVAIDGQRLAGAVRDTVLVPARGSVTIAFDADNPGRWAFHCHNLYHMAAGMMTTVEYET